MLGKASQKSLHKQNEEEDQARFGFFTPNKNDMVIL